MVIPIKSADRNCIIYCPLIFYVLKRNYTSVGITHASIYLKPALVQVVHAAMKTDKSPYYKQKYERIMKHRGKKRAIIALAWMILTAIYHMLSTGEVWNPTDLYKGYSQVTVNGYRSYLNRMKKYVLSLLEPM